MFWRNAVLVAALVFCPRLASAIDPGDIAIGMRIVQLSDLVIEENRIPIKAGITVLYVEHGGPAEQAKIQPFDVITHVGSSQIKSSADYVAAIGSLEVGKVYSFKVLRPVNNRWVAGTVKVKPSTVLEIWKGAMEFGEDAVEQFDFMQHARTPKVDARSEIYVYATGTKGPKPRLWLQVQYVAKDWLFIDQIIIRKGENRYEIPLDKLKVKRDNNGGKIWEWRVLEVTPEIRKCLDDIREIGKATVRYVGADYVKDRDLNVDEAARIDATLGAFDHLGK